MSAAIEALERRTLLSYAVLTNNIAGGTADGNLLLSVDGYGSFGQTNVTGGPTGTLWDPMGPDTIQDSVAVSSLYFQPAGAFLSDAASLNATSLTPPPASPGFSSQDPARVTSSFDIAGFHIDLAQSLAPSQNGRNVLTQTYTITNVSSSAFDGAPFVVTRYMQSYMQWQGANTGQDWGGMSGDHRILLSFDELKAGTNYERIDDNADPGATSGPVPDLSTISADPTYSDTIITNGGIPAADDGLVPDVGNATLLDTRKPAQLDLNAVVMALQDTITLAIGASTTYVTHTIFDATPQDPAEFIKPGTLNILPIPNGVRGQQSDVTVVRTGGTLGRVEVDFNNPGVWAGSAIAGTDYYAYGGDNSGGVPSGTPPALHLAFRDGDTLPSIFEQPQGTVIPTPADRHVHYDLYVVPGIQGWKDVPNQLLNPTNGATLATDPNPMEVDLLLPPTGFPAAFSLEKSSQSWMENDPSGHMLINVTRPSTGAPGNIAIGYRITPGPGSGATPGISATPGVDFVDTTPGASLGTYFAQPAITGSLPFAEGQTSATIDLQLINDAIVETDESFTITLISGNPNLIGTPSTFVGTIIDDDRNRTGPVHFAKVVDAVGEKAGAKLVEVVRDPSPTGDVSGQVTVGYSAGGTAVPGVNYTPLAGSTLTFGPGETSKTITITPIDDGLVNGDTTVLLQLQDINSALPLVGNPRNEQVTIQEQDIGSTVALAAAQVTVGEWAPGRLANVTNDIQVMRTTSDTSLPATVNYAFVDGTAVNGRDYIATPGSATIPAGQMTATIPVQIVDNQLVDGDRSFKVTLSSSDPLVKIGVQASDRVTIHDNDSTIQLSGSSYAVNRNGGNAIVTLTRTGATDTPATASYTLLDGSALNGTDYNFPAGYDAATQTGTVSFPAGATSQTVLVPIIGTNLSAPTRTFTFTLKGAADASTSADPLANVQLAAPVSAPVMVLSGPHVNSIRMLNLSGRTDRIERIVLTFAEPLDGSTVPNTSSYIIMGASSAGNYKVPVSLADAVYDGSTNSVTLFPRRPLSANKMYQLSLSPTGGLRSANGGAVLVSSAPASSGSKARLATPAAVFGRGNRLQYVDKDGDIVTLTVKRGGQINFLANPGGDPTISLLNTSSRSILTGTVRRRGHGDGKAIIAQLLGGTGILDRLRNPPFSVLSVT